MEVMSSAKILHANHTKFHVHEPVTVLNYTTEQSDWPILGFTSFNIAGFWFHFLNTSSRDGCSTLPTRRHGDTGWAGSKGGVWYCMERFSSGTLWGTEVGETLHHC